MDASEPFKNEKGMQQSSVPWLLDHHEAKLVNRKKMVEDFRLQSGDLVLDLGCGPGLWASLLAQKVGSRGRVVGVDFAADAVWYAVNNIAEVPGAGSILFLLGDFHELPLSNSRCDVVFIGNCLEFVCDSYTLLQEVSRVTRSGGRVIAKEFDGGSIIVHPMDPHLLLRVLEASARSLSKIRSPHHFDNFVGRKIHGKFIEAGLRDVSTSTYAVQFTSPLSAAAQRYLVGNARWYGDLAAPYLSERDYARWSSAFDVASADYILSRDDVFFCTVEMVTVGIVRGNAKSLNDESPPGGCAGDIGSGSVEFAALDHLNVGVGEQFPVGDDADPAHREALLGSASTSGGVETSAVLPTKRCVARAEQADTPCGRSER